MDCLSVKLLAGLQTSLGGGAVASAHSAEMQSQNRDPESGPSGALKHLNSWLGRQRQRPTGNGGAVVSAGDGGFVWRTPIEPPPETEHSVVSHLIGARGGEITIDLGHNCFVNLISMQLWDKEPRQFTNSIYEINLAPTPY